MTKADGGACDGFDLPQPLTGERLGLTVDHTRGLPNQGGRVTCTGERAGVSSSGKLDQLAAALRLAQVA
jgi:hypothetical protein